MKAVTILAFYILIVNILASAVTVIDKNAAKKHRRRVRERDLMLISAVGGSVGMFITMKVIHHKTKHPKFMIGIPVMIVLQLILIVVLKYFSVI